MDPVQEPQKFGGLDELKVTIGTGNLICVANDLLPLDERNWRVPVWLISNLLLYSHLHPLPVGTAWTGRICPHRTSQSG